MDRVITQATDFWQTNVLNNTEYVLLLPHIDERLNTLFRTFFASKRGNHHGIIIEGTQADELLTLYSLYAFTDKLIIGSFDLPHGRKLRNLLDSGIATEEELINDVIFGAM